MKRLLVGLFCCLAGILLCAINWLGAAAAVPAVTEWSGGRRINGGWSLVGYWPLIFGIALLVLGLILVIPALFPADGSASESPRLTSS